MVFYFVILLTSPFVEESTSITDTPSSTTLDCSTGSGGGGTDGGTVTNDTTNDHDWVCVDSTTCPAFSSSVCSPSTGSVSSDSSVSFLQYYKATETQTYVPAYNSSEKHNPFDKGFQLAFKWRDNTFDANAFSANVFQVISEDGGATSSTVEHSLEFCNKVNFPAQLDAQLDAISITDYMCISQTNISNFYMKQAPHGQNFSHIYLQLLKCNTGGSCVAGTTYAGSYFDFLYISADYDHTSPADPVKYSINLDNEFIIDVSGRYYFGFKLQKQMFTHMDTTVHTFYKVLKNHEGYQYYQTDIMLYATFLLDDIQISWTPYYEYQPKISSQAVQVGDDLGGAVMQSCRWTAT
mmetsp:Transcript_19999/g.22329  ORF Transcript_19999/g.22329 Transcript_19999/m.22329 type:complete len:351 (-) Transcript_19999:48-1100(-)